MFVFRPGKGPVSGAPRSLKVIVALTPEDVLNNVLGHMREERRWSLTTHDRTSVVFSSRGPGHSGAIKGLVAAERFMGTLGRVLSFGSPPRRALPSAFATSPEDWESLAVSASQRSDGQTVVTFSTHGSNASKLAEQLAKKLA